MGPGDDQTINVKGHSFTFTVIHASAELPPALPYKQDPPVSALPTHAQLHTPTVPTSMKILGVAASALLLAPAACRVVPACPRKYPATNITTLIKVFGTPHAVTSDPGGLQPALGADTPPPAKRPKLDPGSPPAEPDPDPDPPAAESQSEWDKHVCRGEKLTLASRLDKDKAEAFALPIDTRWSGNLQAERQLWGYHDSSDPDCDFEGSYYDITSALEELNVEDGECFRTYHYDPEKEGEIKDQTYKVDGKDYKVRDYLQDRFI